MLKLFYHQWLAARRSLYWQKSVFLNILLGIVGIYILLNFVVIGYYADELIQSVYPVSDTINHFTGLLLFYLIFDFFARFMMQKFPSLIIQPYLTLPIKKQKLIHYPILKSMLGLFNLLGLCLVIPFFIKAVVPSYGFAFSTVWLFSVLALIFSSNFIAFTVKKKFSSNPVFIISFVLFLGVVLYVNFGEVYNLSSRFSAVLLFISGKYYGIFFPILLLVVSYFTAYRTLMNNHRLDDKAEPSLKRTSGATFLDYYGETAGILLVELKMIVRNKRPKSALLYGLLMIPYGFLLYSFNSDDYLLQMFIGFLIISALAMPYGQFVFSWQSSCFDGLMAHNVNLHRYVKSKFFVFSVLAVVSYILSLPFVIKNEQMLTIHPAMLLYTIGISSKLILFFGCFKSKPISLGKNQMFNHEGVSFVDFLIILPVLGLPALLYAGFVVFDITGYFIYGLGIIGINGIVLNRFMLSYIVKLLIRRKYKIGMGFRSK
ncbi:DUF5687 family protein [Natronoflexus pectinivorans]|uniref:ABC-2 type transport system permease protein n=1 Tax=Natronoflexus pectinivorans TaxID=682526 RepID=A0A4R2GIJ5_9BACT|nr:DUF5687 family protein [Natronoflexus pectinivorans]TCO08338.1 hypothetical protein EV194_105142 [Natronoflexus pectinivorans]